MQHLEYLKEHPIYSEQYKYYIEDGSIAPSRPMPPKPWQASSGFGSVPLLGDKKWKFAAASLVLGSVVISFLGQPTLFHIFSKELEVQLWDTQDIVRNNLIAVGAVLGGLLLWNKVRA